ncbi:DUF1460 domain-containing protein [Marinilabiliaceae bacterium ANBcel2]|nr:DUF1460 domain-containing protein [Marinilabiliaceae bacterium ANBcel2]
MRYLVITILFFSGFCSSNFLNAGEHDDLIFKDKPDNVTVDYTPKDSLIFFDAIDFIFENVDVSSATVSDYIVAAGTFFIGTPYVAGTLDNFKNERVTVNLRGMDCVTFVENSLALGFIAYYNKCEFDLLSRALYNLRYRDDKVLSGRKLSYFDRLHYFSEWLQVNKKRYDITLISDIVGDKELDTNVNFISSNPDAYPRIKEDSSYIDKFKNSEQAISQFDMRYIPKEKINSICNSVKSGDVIALVTSIDGLDVSHTGLAFLKNEQLFLLHASLRNDEVEITPVELQEYLKPLDNVKGILVARFN